MGVTLASGGGDTGVGFDRLISGVASRPGITGPPMRRGGPRGPTGVRRGPIMRPVRRSVGPVRGAIRRPMLRNERISSLDRHLTTRTGGAHKCRGDVCFSRSACACIVDVTRGCGVHVSRIVGSVVHSVGDGRG